MKRKEQLVSYYPIFLDISGKRCVVVGGGEVALRKVRVLLEHGANVEVISPELCPELKKIVESGEIRAIPRNYQVGDLNGAFIAIAATNDSDINQMVVQEGHEKAVMVNIVDEPEGCDFIAPSYMRRGDIIIAVSTGGRSPALARKIRTKLEEDFGDEYAALALLINEVRTEVKRQGIKVNGDDWHEALDLDLLIGLVRKGDNERAKAILCNNLKIQQR
ncbi:MAG: bifunctional precorrin-2 dehydrogenase/sirohydrochlorin ferrochelatase [Actinobacteria bacterium]|nr:bifunctional precorrin-2 dehydrogenase/sirohydrochlorin ferrochelatase [Actinomycetota bacterium]